MDRVTQEPWQGKPQAHSGDVTASWKRMIGTREPPQNTKGEDLGFAGAKGTPKVSNIPWGSNLNLSLSWAYRRRLE